jgi:hypothetical protein
VFPRIFGLNQVPIILRIENLESLVRAMVVREGVRDCACVVVVLGLKWFERESCSIGRSWLLKASAFDTPGEVGGERSLRRITSECAVIQEQSPEATVIGCHGGHFYVDSTIRSLRVPLLAMMYSYYDSAVGRCYRAQELRQVLPYEPTCCRV